MGARLISESMFIGASPLALRRLYTAIFNGSSLRQAARSSRGLECFRRRLASRVWASTRATGSAFRIDQGRAADPPRKICQAQSTAIAVAATDQIHKPLPALDSLRPPTHHRVRREVSHERVPQP